MKNLKYESYAEYLKVKNDKYKEWKNKQPEETIKKYKNMLIAKCEVCGNTEYANIYQHRQSNKHIRNLHISNTEA